MAVHLCLRKHPDSADHEGLAPGFRTGSDYDPASVEKYSAVYGGAAKKDDVCSVGEESDADDGKSGYYAFPGRGHQPNNVISIEKPRSRGGASLCQKGRYSIKLRISIGQRKSRWKKRRIDEKAVEKEYNDDISNQF